MELLEIGEKINGVEYNFRNTCYAIVKRGEEILLLYSDQSKNHSLPGGGVEADEKPDEALAREMMEEAGLKIKSSQELVQIHSYWNTHTEKQYVERFVHIFVAKIDEESKQEPLENWHHRVFASVEDAIKLVPFPYQKAALEYYLHKLKNSHKISK